jgi:hypothetical protein
MLISISLSFNIIAVNPILRVSISEIALIFPASTRNTLIFFNTLVSNSSSLKLVGLLLEIVDFCRVVYSILHSLGFVTLLLLFI